MVVYSSSSGTVTHRSLSLSIYLYLSLSIYIQPTTARCFCFCFCFVSYHKKSDCCTGFINLLRHTVFIGTIQKGTNINGRNHRRSGSCSCRRRRCHRPCYRSLGRFLPDCVVVMMMVGDGEYMCGRSAVGKFDSEQPVALLYCSCGVLDLALAI